MSVTAKRIPPPVVPPTEIVLTMDEASARYLLSIVGNITGVGACREAMDAVYAALRKLNVERAEVPFDGPMQIVTST